MNSKMTQQDWDNLHQEWLGSFKTSAPNGKPKRSYQPRVNTTITHKFIRKINMGTPKAHFFLTEHGLAGDFGFWCPKSAIVSIGEDRVEIHSWCKIKVIEYNRY